jgi:hypothetical protein
MAKKQDFGYIEIKGTEGKIGLAEVKEIFASGTRDGVVTCGSFTPPARQFMDEIDVFYVEGYPIEDIINYNRKGKK